jgi:hypothetical protein
MDLPSRDPVHFPVSDLVRAEVVFLPFLGGELTFVYGGPEQNA